MRRGSCCGCCCVIIDGKCNCRSRTFAQYTVSHIRGVALVDEIAFHYRSHDAATDQSAPKSSRRCHHRLSHHHPRPHTMRFQIYCCRHFPTSRRPAALKMIRQTLKSEKNKLDEMFGPQDWSILLQYVYFCIFFFLHLRPLKRRSPQL